VLLKAQWRSTYSVIDCLEPLLEGFFELVPSSLLAKVTAPQLHLMLNGRPDIDIEEIRAYTIYQGCYFKLKALYQIIYLNKLHPIIGSKDFQETYYTVVWLWDILREFTTENRRNFLKFVTGSSRTPLDGYDPPFNLTQGVDMSEDAFPRAHTCFNQLVLPRYSSKENMIQKLLFAFSNTYGFDLA